MTAPATPNFSAAQLATEALQHQFLMLSLIKDIRTAIPVEVVAVHPGSGTTLSIGTVDVQPLIQAVSGRGKNRRLWALEQTYGAKFCRVQAGNTALVIDPDVGDIGLAIVCDRDISSVVAAAGLAGPGSSRTHDISDLVYMFTMISAQDVTQYILANGDGIKILSPNTVTIQGAQINLVGPINANGATIDEDGEITDALGVVVGTHDHEPGTYEVDGDAVTGLSGPPAP
jgi:hypothetical protein